MRDEQALVRRARCGRDGDATIRAPAAAT